MKLRIQGNALRFRLSRTDVARFTEERLLEETIYLGTDAQSKLTYALVWNASIDSVQVQSLPQRITVLLPESEVVRWSSSEQVSIEESIDLGAHGVLTLLVEKDFACLDRSPEENADAFPNPLAGQSC